MKKRVGRIASAVFVSSVFFLLIACSFTVPEESSYTDTVSHTHTFSNEWSYDMDYHWHSCTGCSSVADKGKHVFYYEVVSEPTETVEGLGKYVCAVCSAEIFVGIPVKQEVESGSFFEIIVPGSTQGSIVMTHIGSASNGWVWTFEFIEQDEAHKALVYQWSVNGVLMEGENSSSFDFRPSGHGNHVIRCDVANYLGSGFAEMSVFL